jgi:hypothetical protein
MDIFALGQCQDAPARQRPGALEAGAVIARGVRKMAVLLRKMAW